MASDEHVSAALKDFAEEIMRASRAEFSADSILSPEQLDARRQRLRQLAAEAEAMAANSRTASYREFERRLKEVQDLGTQIQSETIIRVASAFMQRPHLSHAMRSKPGNSPGQVLKRT